MILIAVDLSWDGKNLGTGVVPNRCSAKCLPLYICNAM